MVTTTQKIYDPFSLAKQSTRQLANLPHGRYGIFKTVFGDRLLYILTGTETMDGSGDSPILTVDDPDAGVIEAAFFFGTGITARSLQEITSPGPGQVQFRANDMAGAPLTGASIDFRAIVIANPA